MILELKMNSLADVCTGTGSRSGYGFTLLKAKSKFSSIRRNLQRKDKVVVLENSIDALSAKADKLESLFSLSKLDYRVGYEDGDSVIVIDVGEVKDPMFLKLIDSIRRMDVLCYFGFRAKGDGYLSRDEF